MNNHCRKILRIVCFLLALALIQSNAFSQLAVDRVDAGPYTPGSTIAATFSIDAGTCIEQPNVFEMYLSNASGSFASETRIGTYTGFYSTYVNGIIPAAGIPAGTGYRIRIKSTAPVSVSAPSAAFEIKAGAAVEAKLNSSLLNASNAETFGTCNTKANNSLTIINASTNASSVTATITDELLGAGATNITFDTPNKTFVAQLAHYTIFAKAVMPNGTVATKAYLIVNNKAVTAFASTNNNVVCLPQGFLEFNVDYVSTGGIQSNFPGDRYVVDWGDGSSNIYSICDIRNLLGQVRHEYTTSSCGKTSNTTTGQVFNAFNVSINVSNTFCGNIGTAISSYAKVIEKPINQFTFNPLGCTNEPVTFTNTSVQGNNPETTSNGCIPNVLTFNWFVDGVLVAPNKPISYKLVWPFTTHGNHTIRLESTNPGFCDAAPFERTICIQDKPKPAFSFTQTTICSPSVIKPTDASIVDDICNTANAYNWTVTPAVTYAGGTNSSSREPQFNFTNPGIYTVTLNINTASCGSIASAPQKIIVNKTPTASLSPNAILCNLAAYDFNTTAGPTQTTFDGTFKILPTTYQWTVSGGAYSFTEGTGPNSQYPSIKFDEYALYTVTVKHSNNCGTVTKTQKLQFTPAPQVNAGPNQTICYNEPKVMLEGMITTDAIGNVTGQTWIGGNGTFLPNRNTLNATYQPTTAERDAGLVTLTLRVTTSMVAPCNSIDDNIEIAIGPKIVINSAALKTICTGSAVNYTIGSSVAGTTFSWTASGGPNAGGYDMSGSGGTIANVLTNSDPVNNAQVVYTIIPHAGGCTGDPFTLKVNITPNPIASAVVAEPTICSQQSGLINLTSNLNNTRYTWTSTASAGINGNSSNSSAASISSISDLLSNNGTTSGTVTYVIVPVSENGCEGNPVTVEIRVEPLPSLAHAGPDEEICSSSSYLLKANAPAVGSGKWTQSTSFPGVTFADDTRYNTTVNGLEEGNTYIFTWTIKSTASCGTKSDNVSIKVSPQSVGGTTTGSASYCAGTSNSGSILLSGNVGNIIRWESTTDDGETWISINSTANPYVYTNILESTKFRAIVLSGLCSEAASAESKVTINPAVVAALAGADQSLCEATTAALNGNSPLSNTGLWTLISGQTGVTITDPGLYNTTVSGLNADQTYIFKWTISGLAPCPSSSDEVHIRINPASNGGITAGSIAVCSGSSNDGAISLSNEVGAIVRWEKSTDGSNWISTGTTANPYIFDNVTVTTQYRAVVKSGNCSEAFSTVSTVTVNPAAIAADAGPDQVLCDESATLLAGNSPLSNTGLWTLTSGQTGVTITDPGLYNTTVSGLNADQTYIFKWTISGLAPCPSSSDEVQIRINPASNGGITAGSIAVCSGSSNGGAISLSDEVGAIVRWEKSTDGSNWISTGTTANPYIFDNVTVTTQYRAVVKSGNCPEAFSTVSTVTVNPAVIAADAGPDQVLCNEGSALLAGNSPLSNTGLWTLTSGQTGVTITDPGLYNTTVSGLNAGQTYIFKWTISGLAPCPSSSDEVQIRINPASNGGITAGDVSVCTGSSNRGSVSLSGQVGSIIRWEKSTDNGLNWVNTGSRSNPYVYTNVAATTQFRAIVGNGNCSEAISTVSTITVNPITVVALAGSNQALCSGNAITLNGNNPAPNIGTWTLISNQNGVLFTDPAKYNTTVTGLIPGQTYTFRWTISGFAPCADTFSETTVTYYDPVINEISASSVPICFGQSATIQGDTPTGGQGNYTYQWQKSLEGTNWEEVPGGINKNLTVKLNASAFFRRLVNSTICTSTSNQVQILVWPELENNTIADNQTVCAGTAVQELKGSLPKGGNGTYTYQWQNSLDNGQSWVDVAGATGVNFLPPTPVNPVFYRRMVSSGSCSGNSSNEVRIIFTLPAKAEINFVRDKECAPFQLSANNIKAVDYTDRNGTYTWYADGVEIGTGINFPGYKISEENKKIEIKLLVTSSLGCVSDETTHVFSTYENVLAAYKQSSTGGCGPLAVSFTNTSNSLVAATFKWDFGNGVTSNAASPPNVTYLPDPAGKDTTYQVIMEATTPCGITTQTSTVLVKGNPLSVFSPDQTMGCSPFTVTFTNTSPGNSGVFYYDFGDGNTLTTTDKSSVTHTYTTLTVKDFAVKMIAQNDCGTNESQYSIRVAPNDIIPALVVNSNEQRGCAPFKVNFYNNTKGANNFVYDFGDGNKALTNAAPEVMVHTFTKPGTYNVTIYASNSCSKATATQTIVVLDQPDVNFTADKTAGCAGLVVKFKNSTSNGVSYLWDFGDGTTSTEFEPQHIFTGTDVNYTVNLTATNSTGCSNTYSIQNYIKIAAPPQPLFSVTPGNQQLVPNYTFSFRDMSKGADAGIWEWDFGDGNRSTQQHPSHTYGSAGNYTVTLKVYNKEGCAESSFQMVKIISVAGTLNVPNAFMPASAINDVRIFKPKGVGMEEWHLMIFNKWGQLLWETTKLEDGSPAEGWDGTYNGQEQPQGTYFWKIDVKFINKTSWKGMSYTTAAPKKTGVIYLIR